MHGKWQVGREQSLSHVLSAKFVCSSARSRNKAQNSMHKSSPATQSSLRARNSLDILSHPPSRPHLPCCAQHRILRPHLFPIGSPP